MWIQATMGIEIFYIVFYFKWFKNKISEFRHGKTSSKRQKVGNKPENPKKTAEKVEDYTEARL